MTSGKETAQIWESLRDPEYRHQMVEEEINIGLAFQIRAIRNRQNLTQKDLADKLDVKQPLVSAWENSNYGKYSIKTLKELARAFDVALQIRFVPFSQLVNITANLSKEDIAPPNFNEEVPQLASASGDVRANAHVPNVGTAIFSNVNEFLSGDCQIFQGTRENIRRFPVMTQSSTTPSTGISDSGTVVYPLLQGAGT